MKTKKDIYFIIAFGIIGAAIVFVAVFKFVITREPELPFAVNGLTEIALSDMDGNGLKLRQLIAGSPETYCLIFNLKDCHGCIYDGVEVLNKLKAEGKVCLGLAVHDNLDDLNGWSINFDFRPFFMMKTLEFFDHIKSPITPVLIKIKDDKVENYRFFTAH